MPGAWQQFLPDKRFSALGDSTTLLRSKFAIFRSQQPIRSNNGSNEGRFRSRKNEYGSYLWAPFGSISRQNRCRIAGAHRAPQATLAIPLIISRLRNLMRLVGVARHPAEYPAVDKIQSPFNYRQSNPIFVSKLLFSSAHAD